MSEDPQVSIRRAEYCHATESDNTMGSLYNATSVTFPPEFSGNLTTGIKNSLLAAISQIATTREDHSS